MTRRTAGLAPVEHIELPPATRKSIREELTGDDTATGSVKRKRPQSGTPGSPRKRIKHESDSIDILPDVLSRNEPTEPLEVIPPAQTTELGDDQTHDEERVSGALIDATNNGHDGENTSQNEESNVEQQQHDVLDFKNESSQTTHQDAARRINEQVINEPVRSLEEHPILEVQEFDNAEVTAGSSANGEIVPPSSQFWTDPSGWLKPKIQPLLQQLAAHILSVFSEIPLLEMQRLLENPQYHLHIESWKSLQATFLQARKIISPYLSYLNEAEPLNMGSGAIQQINLATALSTFVRPEVTMGGLAETHHMFLDIFCRLSRDLSPWQADLFYSIKLQVLKHRTANEPSARLRILDEIFPRNLEAKLRISLKRHISEPFSFTESDFLNRCLQTRESLDRAVPEFDVKDKNGSWKQVIEKIGPYCKSYVQRVLEIPLSDYPPRDYQIRHPLSFQTAPPITPISQPSAVGSYEDVRSPVIPQTQPLAPPQPQHPIQSQPPPQPLFPPHDDDDGDDHVRRAALAAHAALLGSMSNGIRPASSFGQFSSRPQNIKSENRQSPFLRQRSPSSQELASQIAEGSSQSFSTKEQYERARMAATAKAASKSKGASVTPSQRRPWSSEEEEALMSGLDRVQGPHWSAILAMYGTGGTVSEVLKDRNQVQLKDKARNLKLFFLKGGHEVPHYLQNVTGELKTRAPAQAAKNEVREMLEESGNEDKATADAISVLAAGRRSFTAINGSPPAEDGASTGSPATSRSAASPSPVAIAATFGTGKFMQEHVSSQKQTDQEDTRPSDGDAGAPEADEDQFAAADKDFAQAIQLALAASRRNEEEAGDDARGQQQTTSESLRQSSTQPQPPPQQPPAPQMNGPSQAQSV